MKKEVAARIRAIFNASNLQTTRELLRDAVKEYTATAPKLAAWLEEAIPEGLTVFTLPECQRRFLRTSAADIRAIFNAQDKAEADALLKRAVQKYEKAAPRLSVWLEENLPEGLSVFAFPLAHRRLLRTTNGVERVNREVRRRTRVASIFPNEASCLRLVSALLMEISDDWQVGKAYLTFTES